MNRTPAKRFLFLLVAMPLSVVVRAGPANTLSGEVLACRDIVPDAARLTCFDRMAATVAPARVSSAPQAAAVAPAPVSSAPLAVTTIATPVSSAPGSATLAAPAVKDALDPQRTFGLSHAAIAEREASAAGVRVEGLSHIIAHVTRILHAPDRGAIFDLDNGQVWKQLDPDGTDVDANAGDSIEISRGLLGSYWLVTSSHQRFNVTRVR